MKPWPYPRWLAHRGAGVLAPENTLAAFRLGAEQGFQMFECDVKTSADGVGFLHHDATLERTTNGIGLAGRLSAAELAKLDAGSWHSAAYRGEPVCQLRDLASWLLPRGLMLNIEIKPSPGTESETGELVAREALLLWGSSRPYPFLTSFQPQSLASAARVAPELPRGLLLGEWRSDVFDFLSQGQHQALVCQHALWTPERLQQAQRLGIWRLSYTVNDPSVAAKLWQWGHEAIITDAIDLFDPKN